MSNDATHQHVRAGQAGQSYEQGARDLIVLGTTATGAVALLPRRHWGKPAARGAVFFVHSVTRPSPAPRPPCVNRSRHRDVRRFRSLL